MLNKGTYPRLKANRDILNISIQDTGADPGERIQQPRPGEGGYLFDTAIEMKSYLIYMLEHTGAILTISIYVYIYVKLGFK